MDKHTPGPWKWGGDIDDDPYVVMIGGFRSKDCRYTGATTNEAVANAKLIASAPDLLAENERLRTELRRLSSLVAALGSTAMNKGEPTSSEHNQKILSMGDTIVVNEGALWFLVMQANQAFESVRAVLAQPGSRE